MAWRTLEELVAGRLLEPKPADRRRVAGWLTRSKDDVALARDVLAVASRDRAMAVAYEAGFRACGGLIVLEGYRVTSQPGHHRAAIEGAAAVLGAESRPLLRRIDAARKFRNESLYGDGRPAAEAELDGLLADVSRLLEILAQRLNQR